MDFLRRMFSDFTWMGLIVLILTIVAMWLVALKNEIAFILFTISQLIQIYIFYRKNQGFLILTMIALITMNGVSYYKWIQ